MMMIYMIILALTSGYFEYVYTRKENPFGTYNCSTSVLNNVTSEGLQRENKNVAMQTVWLWLMADRYLYYIQ